MDNAEPMFVLHGSDRAAVDALTAYLHAVSQADLPSDLIAETCEQLREFQSFRDRHPALMRFPRTVGGGAVMPNGNGGGGGGR